ncbi:MAG: hypothetical protein KAJ01_10075 [Candidatus Hydrogenedentes bacterium]|nr:hypothetical protein [Candidatus Hydrogenedentota bacterium]
MAEDKPLSSRYAGATFEKYKAKRLPAVYIIDREGKVRYQELPLEAVEAAVQTVRCRG